MIMDEGYKNELYRKVAEEISSNIVDQGLWLRALVESNNDNEIAKTRYAKLRIEELFREIEKNINDNIKSEEDKVRFQREIKKALKDNEKHLLNK